MGFRPPNAASKLPLPPGLPSPLGSPAASCARSSSSVSMRGVAGSCHSDSWPAALPAAARLSLRVGSSRDAVRCAPGSDAGRIREGGEQMASGQSSVGCVVSPQVAQRSAGLLAGGARGGLPEPAPDMGAAPLPVEGPEGASARPAAPLPLPEASGRAGSPKAIEIRAGRILPPCEAKGLASGGAPSAPAARAGAGAAGSAAAARGAPGGGCRSCAASARRRSRMREPSSSSARGRDRRTCSGSRGAAQVAGRQAGKLLVYARPGMCTADG